MMTFCHFLQRNIDLGKELRMYCIDTEALVFMFNGGSPYGFTMTLFLLLRYSTIMSVRPKIISNDDILSFITEKYRLR